MPTSTSPNMKVMLDIYGHESAHNINITMIQISQVKVLVNCFTRLWVGCIWASRFNEAMWNELNVLQLTQEPWINNIQANK